MKKLQVVANKVLFFASICLVSACLVLKANWQEPSSLPAARPQSTTLVDSRNSSSPVVTKPTLVLHVGPMKTATTTLQMYLRDKAFQNALLKDNFQTVNFDYIQFRKLIDTCLDKGSLDCDWTLWNEFIGKLERAAAVSSSHSSHSNETAARFAASNVLHSAETWSRIPSSNFTKELIRNLQDTWNVRIILTYRSLDRWLPSLYAQYRKGTMYLSRSGRWKRYPGRKEMIQTFPDWFDQVWNDNLRDAHGVKLLFQDIFGPEAITVLDMRSSASNGTTVFNIQTEFACRGIGAVSHACNRTKYKFDRNKTKKSRVENSSAQFLIDHDLLVVEANRQGLIQSRNKVDRHSATLLVHKKLNDLNMTMDVLPRVCLSKEQMDRLKYRTWLAEAETAPTPRSFEETNDGLAKNKDKYCSVDAPAVLQQETWRDFFSSCAFRQEGCSS